MSMIHITQYDEKFYAKNIVPSYELYQIQSSLDERHNTIDYKETSDS